MAPATPFLKILKPIPLDCSSGPVTFNLSTSTPALSFIRVGNTTNATTIVAPDGYTIQGAATRDLFMENETLVLILRGTDWGVY